MNKQLINDLCRCYGYTCNLKLSCKRHLTMELDRPGLYAYHTHLSKPVEPTTAEISQCDSYMEDCDDVR